MSLLKLDDWELTDWWVTSYRPQPAKRKAIIFDPELGNPRDVTDLFPPSYEARIVNITIEKACTKASRNNLMNFVEQSFNGVRFNDINVSDDFRHWRGRCNVAQYNFMGTTLEVSLEFVCDPDPVDSGGEE